LGHRLKHVYKEAEVGSHVEGGVWNTDGLNIFFYKSFAVTMEDTGDFVVGNCMAG
jgi:hypothetical protein